jgi:hypothetical protein
VPNATDQAVESKVCELCGRLFTRFARPVKWVENLNRYLEMPRSPICHECTTNPPKEEEAVVVHHTYRLALVQRSRSVHY